MYAIKNIKSGELVSDREGKPDLYESIDDAEKALMEFMDVNPEAIEMYEVVEADEETEWITKKQSRQ